MIVAGEKSVDEADGVLDAPPSYDELVPSHVDAPNDRKRPAGLSGPAGSARAGSSTSSDAASTSNSPATSPKPCGPNKTWFSWLSDKDTRKEVKQTIQSLMRDVVKEPESPAAVSVLQSCLEACQARGLSFQSVVSEKFIEGHCPLYWAIVKQPTTNLEEPRPTDRVSLIDILLSIPLNPTTRSDAYLACLLTSDQELYQRLRHIPGNHSPSVSAAHELLLGDTPEDEVKSFHGNADHGEFRIVWKIHKFQKRMRAIGGVVTEVVARGRIWVLAITSLPRDAVISRTCLKAGTWVASVSLLAPSPSTHLTAQFSIQEPIFSDPPPESPSRELDDAQNSPSPSIQKQPRKNLFAAWSGLSRSPKPPIRLQVKTERTQLDPLPLRLAKQGLQEYVLTHPGVKNLVVPLHEHVNGDSLQFDGCSYLNPDESLDVLFEGRLTKDVGGECIIC